MATHPPTAQPSPLCLHLSCCCYALLPAPLCCSYDCRSPWLLCSALSCCLSVVLYSVFIVGVVAYSSICMIVLVGRWLADRCWFVLGEVYCKLVRISGQRDRRALLRLTVQYQWMPVQYLQIHNSTTITAAAGWEQACGCGVPCHGKILMLPPPSPRPLLCCVLMFCGIL